MSRLFAISDIHGCLNPFHDLIVDVIDLKKDDRLVLLGDYIDRGAQSRQVIDFILDLQKSGFDLKILAGNHEQMMLESWHNPEILPLWYLNNGMITLDSFGVLDVKEVGEEYIRFISELPFYYKEGNILFVHAGFNDFLSDPFSDNHYMIWECRSIYQNPVLSGKIIIHGHRPKTLEYVKRQLSDRSLIIPIDTGCVYNTEPGYGNLSALEVNSMTLFSVANR